MIAQKLDKTYST